MFCFSTNLHIKIISEGSYDTEDWRNDSENSALLCMNVNTLFMLKGCIECIDTVF